MAVEDGKSFDSAGAIFYIVSDSFITGNAQVYPQTDRRPYKAPCH
jgi:hypothetical protein